MKDTSSKIVTAFVLLVICGAVFLIIRGKAPSSNDNIAKPLAPGQRLEFAINETPQPIENLKFYADGSRPVMLSDWKGKKLILNIWATWCAPCVEELPWLSNLKTALKRRGGQFDVVALSVDRRKDFKDLKKFFKKHDVTTLTPYLDLDKLVVKNLDLTGFPVTYILDRNGKILTRHQGPLKWDDPKVIDALMRL